MTDTPDPQHPDNNDQNNPRAELARPDGIGPVNPDGGKPRRHADKAHIEARRIKVEELELARMSVREIARRVEVSPGTVMADLKAIRARRRVEWGAATVVEHRDRELGRLEAQGRELMELLIVCESVPDLVSVHHRLLQVHDRVSRLLGLAAPTKVEVSVSTATLAEKLEAYLAGVNDADQAEHDGDGASVDGGTVDS